MQWTPELPVLTLCSRKVDDKCAKGINNIRMSEGDKDLSVRTGSKQQIFMT